jgi:hypothetical protein
MRTKENADAAQREARIWLCVRGMIYPDYIRDVVDESEAQVVLEQLDTHNRGTHRAGTE